MINQNIMNIEMKADIFCDEHNFKWKKKHLSTKNVFSNKPFKGKGCCKRKSRRKKNIKIVQQKKT